jgi:hypothetical protein
MFTRPECVDCRTLAPQTNTYYTLIGPIHSWRMSRASQPDGEVLIEWRCPTCWRRFKAAAAITGTYPSSGKLQASRAANSTSVPPEAPAKPSKSSR